MKPFSILNGTVLALIVAVTAAATPSAFAMGPSVSGGSPPAPRPTTAASIETPVSGLDFPTDSVAPMQAILVLDVKRIPIYDVVPKIVEPRAGVDFPTDSTAPAWTQSLKVLQFEKHYRVPLLLTSSISLQWEIRNQTTVEVTAIAEIRRSEAGVDYPTDYPAQDFYLLVMTDGARIPLR